MLETNKQALRFNFGEDLSYFVILRYRLRNFIKMYDNYVNDQTKGDFQKTLLLFHIGRKSFMECGGGRGGHFHINLYGTCRFSGYHFSA